MTQRTQNKNYCFTSFNMNIDWENLDIPTIDTKQSIKYLVYQGEYTKDNNKHIQGFIQFHNKKDLSFVKKLFGDNTLHLEKMRGTPTEASEYCKKAEKDGNVQETFFSYREYGELDTTVARQRTDLLELRERILEGDTINKIMMTTDDNKTLHNCIQYNKTLREFQHQVHQTIQRKALIEQYNSVIWNDKQQIIIDIINEELDTTNHRRVNWFYDEQGNIGKTHLAKYYVAQGDCYYITGGKQADILYAYEGQKIIIYDLARTYSDNLDHIYTTIENFKNGFYLSTKYNTEQRIYKDQPIIIVLANFQPDTTKLSEDRWNIINMANNGTVINTITNQANRSQYKQNHTLSNDSDIADGDVSDTDTIHTEYDLDTGKAIYNEGHPNHQLEEYTKEAPIYIYNKKTGFYWNIQKQEYRKTKPRDDEIIGRG